jgi:hypothetical protein
MEKRMRIKPTEADVLRACLDWLNLQPGVLCWRQNTGAVVSEYRGRKRLVRFGPRGQADITGIARGGVRVEVEIKREGKRPTEEQLRRLELLRAYGAIALWCDSLESCQAQWREHAL